MTDELIYRRSLQTSASGSAMREEIVKDPGSTFVWRKDDYPCELGQWNYHPEFEIHLARKGRGRVFVGDHIGKFSAGYLAIVGSNLPHNWVSDIAPGEVIEGRDIVIQFDPETLLAGQDVFPEFRNVSDFLERAARGLHFFGRTAEGAAQMIEDLGTAFGFKRLVIFLGLIECLSSSEEYEVLCSDHYAPHTSIEHTEMMSSVLSYISESYTTSVNMSAAADLAGMSHSRFSKAFRKNTGHKFVDYIRKVRVGHATALLLDTDLPVTEICFRSSFENISYFNRQFLREKGVSPRQYRKLAKRSE